MTFDQIAALINSGGVVVLLVAALYGGYKGWWVFGKTFAAKEADLAASITEKNEWKAMALRLLTTAEKTATLADAIAKKNGGAS